MQPLPWPSPTWYPPRHQLQPLNPKPSAGSRSPSTRRPPRSSPPPPATLSLCPRAHLRTLVFHFSLCRQSSTNWQQKNNAWARRWIPTMRAPAATISARCDDDAPRCPKLGEASKRDANCWSWRSKLWRRSSSSTAPWLRWGFGLPRNWSLYSQLLHPQLLGLASCECGNWGKLSNDVISKPPSEIQTHYCSRKLSGRQVREGEDAAGWIDLDSPNHNCVQIRACRFSNFSCHHNSRASPTRRVMKKMA